jgi:tetratricopeptide (TPR) repeat protein
LKRLDEALASYDKALALKSDYVDAFNNRGVAPLELERLDEALASYDQALGAGAQARIRGGPMLESFADTAALISQLDLIMSVDTGVAHLAGMLGRPVCILLPFIPDWR